MNRLKSIFAVWTMMAATSAALAQQSKTQAPAPQPASSFEVVTIKPSEQGDGSYSSGLQKNIYRTKDAPLARVILDAYLPVMGAPKERLKGAPAWVMTDGYDIVAKADDATADTWKDWSAPQRNAVAPLLRNMLEDRCKLVAHTAPVEIQGYALVVSKHGTKMKAAQPGDTPPEKMINLPHGGKGSAFDPNNQAAPTRYQISMAELAAYLSFGYEVQIVDQTGLQGTYDFYVSHRQPEPQDGPLAPIDRLRLWGLDQIGLDLKPTKVTVQQVVIDHIEKPTAN